MDVVVVVVYWGIMRKLLVCLSVCFKALFDVLCVNCRLEMVRCVDGVVHLVPGKCLPTPRIRFTRQHW